MEIDEPAQEVVSDSIPEFGRLPVRPKVPLERSLEWTGVTIWEDGRTSTRQDSVAAEEPLEICIADCERGDRPLAVTMRTPGHDRELAAGFLLTEGLIEQSDDLLSVELAPVDTKASSRAMNNRLRVTLRDPGSVALEHLQRNFFASSSCGLCGKATIDAVRNRGLRAAADGVMIAADLICELPAKLNAAQTIFAQTGGLHAAALFDALGNLLVLREDIGRHNAVDKVVGWALEQRLVPLREQILLVSGRCGFEIAQKALAAGIPVVASISAPSSLAVQLARELGLTLIGFLRDRRFVVYSAVQRCTL